MKNKKLYANSNVEYRIRIDEKIQKELFVQFFRRFNTVTAASNFLGISNGSFSKYYRCTTKYIPYEVIHKISEYLTTDFPQIIEFTSLREIRQKYMKKAHSMLAKKYGEKWASELTKRRDYNEIHLSDFPDDTYVYLEDNFRKKFLKYATYLFGSQNKLMNSLSMGPSSFVCWFKGYQRDYNVNKVGVQFMSLNIIKKISNYLIEDHNYEFSIEEVEKHVLMYRLPAGNPIKYPILPIKESPSLVRLLFHFLGDGYGGRKGECANYKNTCPELLQQFKHDLKIFGDVPIYEQKDSIKFPRVIAEVIKKFYNVELGTFDSRISDKIKAIPKIRLYKGIGAFADDEGSAYCYSIRFTSANYHLIKGIRELVVEYLKMKANPIKEQSNIRARLGKTYYFDLRDLRLFHNKIGFTHPKKVSILKEAIKRAKRIDN